MSLTLTYSHHPYLSPPTIPVHRHNLSFLFSTSQVEVNRFGRSQRLARFRYAAIRAVDGGRPSPWDEKPYEITPTGDKAYLDEEDVVTFLDPPKDLIPLEPASYNPASYLWKKIEDIPEDRRHRLLALLKPRLISKAWQIAGTRYEDPNLAKKCASNLLSCKDDETSIEFYNCRSNGGPWPIAWMKSFKKVIFHCNDGNTFGRLIVNETKSILRPFDYLIMIDLSSFQFVTLNSRLTITAHIEPLAPELCGYEPQNQVRGPILAQFTNTISPLYFTVVQSREVMSTEQPCDLAYEMGDGHISLDNCPQGFPRPAKHPYPFNDQVVIYVRHIGPGVLVGQAWQEGRELRQVPKKLCGEILMVKEYGTSLPHISE